jgi:hypothetical protein
MLITLVDRHLRRTRTPPSRFGRDALGDPNFVFNLREGREPRSRTRRRVEAFILAREADLLAHYEP